MKVNYIIWHTAAYGNPATKEVYDTTAADIDQWHKARGWDGIGYHYVVRLDGTIEEGRPLTKPGAHARGLNRNSIGICFSGHGDLQPLTYAQLMAGLDLTEDLMKSERVPWMNVIGHRELRILIKEGALSPRFHTSKSCPGHLVDMDKVRGYLLRKERPLPKSTTQQLPNSTTHPDPCAGCKCAACPVK